MRALMPKLVLIAVTALSLAVDSSLDSQAADRPVPPGLTWVRANLTGGEYHQGCSEGDTSCTAAELPARDSSQGYFDIMDAEATQAQFKAIMGTTPSGEMVCPDCPVYNVSWADAQAFCVAIGGHLPTEVEWEIAARGGATTRYSCGDDPSCLKGVAWFKDNNKGVQPVKSKKPNAMGLYDMMGSVWEWTGDCWHHNLKYQGEHTVPWGSGLETWKHDCGAYRVRRGGSRFSEATEMRVSNRVCCFPLHVTSSTPVGFRCAK